MHRIDDISQVCIVGYELLLILFGNHSSKKLTVFRKINSQTNRLFKWCSKYYLPCFFLLFLYNYFIIMFYNIIEILFRLGCSGFCFVFVFFLRQCILYFCYQLICRISLYWYFFFNRWPAIHSTGASSFPTLCLNIPCRNIKLTMIVSIQKWYFSCTCTSSDCWWW
jgi:hypothetical protein